MRAILITAILVFVQSTAMAGGLSQWKHYFGDTPVEFRNDLRRLPQIVPPACKGSASTVVYDLSLYQRATRRKDVAAANAAAKDLHWLIGSLERRNSPCFMPAVQVYSLGSLILSLKDDDEVLSNYHLAPLIVQFLFGRNKVHAVTPTTRGDLGAVWNLKTGKRHLAIGGYKCSTGSIYIDPYLRPYDFGSSIIHELDHFLRDKLTTLIPRYDSKSVLVFDELMAVLHGALIQRMLPFKFDEMGEFTPPKYAQDLSMYARGGAFDQLFSAYRISYTDGTITGLETLSSMGIERSRQVIQDGIWERSNWLYFFKFFFNFLLDVKKQLPERDQIAKLVHEAYFPGVKNPDLRFRPFPATTLVGTLADFPISDITGTKDLLNWPKELDPSEVEVSCKLSSPEICHVNINKLVSLLRRLDRDFKSPLCNSFMSSADRGELNDYIGVDSGNKHGHEGVKPGSEGVKPCTRFSQRP